MPRLAVLAVGLACLLALAACGGGDDAAELERGVVRIGAVPGPTAWDAQVLNGVRAAVRALDLQGGVDGKVRLRLLVGQARRLVGGGARILVLPCDARLQAASAAAVQGAAVLALEPCNTQIWRRFPDVWPVSVSPPAEARVLVDYVRQQGYERVAIVGDGRAALAGSVFLTFGFPDPGSELDELFERYRALTGHPPSSSVAALGYDAVRVLEEAMVEAGSTEPAALAATMPGLEAYGATGTIAYPDGGGRDPSVDVALVRIENGGLALVDRVKAS